MVELFYTTYISVDLAHHELFRAKVCTGGLNIEKPNFTQESITSIFSRRAVTAIYVPDAKYIDSKSL